MVFDPGLRDAAPLTGRQTRESAGARGFPPWLAVLVVGAVAAGAGLLGAHTTARRLEAELALRPPVILVDIAAAVQGAEPTAFAAVAARERAQAERLAAGGFLVLDAQAVIAAPPELYLTPAGAAGD